MITIDSIVNNCILEIIVCTLKNLMLFWMYVTSKSNLMIEDIENYVIKFDLKFYHIFNSIEHIFLLKNSFSRSKILLKATNSFECNVC